MSQWESWTTDGCEGHETDDSGQGQCGWGKKVSERECPGPHRCKGRSMKVEKCFSRETFIETFTETFIDYGNNSIVKNFVRLVNNLLKL